MLKNQDGSPPSCFGLHYSPSATECIGGYDSKYPDDNHIRDRCEFVGTCSARMQLNKPKEDNNLISANRLLSRPYTSFGNTTQPSGYVRPTEPSYPTQAAVPPPPQQQASYPRSQQAYTPYQAPQHYQQVTHPGFSGQYGIPQYLSIREPVATGGLGKRMGLEVLRSMGKSFGHTIANFFDSEIFGNKS